ncbi:MAG: polyprenyl synthetase family protein [Myxococcales bacterium]|nr:polyprenyl synthetase family protein [Myxococcales bacterium]
MLGTLGRCGSALGIAFQLMGDVHEVTGDSAITGKDVLADLREGKLSCPFSLAWVTKRWRSDELARGWHNT